MADLKELQVKKKAGRPRKDGTVKPTPAPAAGLYKPDEGMTMIEKITLRDEFALAALAGGIKPANCWNEADYMLKHRDDATKSSK
jgi:hypothetical protein